MDILEQFKKKFARALLTKDDEELVRRMTEFSVKVDKENKKVEIHASFASISSELFLSPDLYFQCAAIPYSAIWCILRVLI